MTDLSPQFADLQDRLSALAPPPVPPGPPGAPPVTPMLPAAEAAAGGNTDLGSILSSPWLWVAIVVLLLIGLFFWYKSQKKNAASE